MAFENFTNHLKEVVALLKNYAESNLTLYKLKALKQIAKMGGAVFKAVLCFILLPLALFFICIAAAIFVGQYLDSYALGFLILGGFYIVLAILAILIGTGIVRRKIVKKLSQKMFKDEE